MQAAEVLRLVSGALQDLEPGLESRWKWEGGSADSIGLLDFLNDAQRAIVLQRPDASVITEAIRLEPGMTQYLPCPKRHKATHEASLFIELVRNAGCDGCSPGQPIFPVVPALLLAWASAGKTSPVIDNFAYDRLTNKNLYYVYPGVPQECNVWVEATYSYLPRAVSSPEETLGIPDEYTPALKHYILASIFLGDNESSNLARASQHMQLYAATLGIKMQVDAAWPKARSSTVNGG